MKFLIVLSCMVLSAYGYFDSTEHGVSNTGISPNCTCGWANKGGERIVNGRPTKIFEYPMLAGMVSRRMDMIVCGAAIITDKHAVTAAHCVHNQIPLSFFLHVGSYSYERGSHGSLHTIARFTKHPRYDPNTLRYDIAVIEVNTRFQFSNTLGPVCLPSGRLNLVGQPLKVLGWGRLSSGGHSSPYLLQTYLQVREHEFCHEVNSMMDKYNRHQICTFTRGTDSCQGDSGGPLLWRNPVTNRYTLAAVVSYGVNCAVYPAVNTDVSVFVPWIQEVIARTGSSRTCSHNR